MNSPRILDVGLLAEFEARLRDQGAPAIDAAQPGLSEEAMQALVAPLGLRLPHEARVWWGWHDGVARDAGDAAREIGPRRKWLLLQEAVEECTTIRKMNADVWGTDPAEAEVRWSSSWFPLVHSEGLVVIDTGVPDEAPCPVWVRWFDERPGPPHLPSIGDLVAVWIDAIDRGAWRYDREGDHWVSDKDRLEPWVAKIDLA
ncbi:MAG: hypothetical protein M3155_07925 [Actinomycetota bacterium]|nr:hypothetical protein [Actinomycetota bacterium]